tara:strand:+ start:162 stop:569 length:408 start_codon:yes stop_codon:yes gene_type:complete
MRTAKQEAFIDAYCLTGNAKKSAVMAGYPEKSAKQKGHDLKVQFMKEIKDRIERSVMDAAPVALSAMRSLAAEAASETVRLAANKDLLDRAGLKPTDRIEQQISHVEHTSTDELKRELEALVGTEEVEEVPSRLN